MEKICKLFRKVDLKVLSENPLLDAIAMPLRGVLKGDLHNWTFDFETEEKKPQPTRINYRKNPIVYDGTWMRTRSKKDWNLATSFQLPFGMNVDSVRRQVHRDLDACLDKIKWWMDELKLKELKIRRETL